MARRGMDVLTLCGEMGGKPLEAIALAALGYRGLSMTLRHRPVKAALLAVDLAETRAFLMRMIETNEDALGAAELKLLSNGRARLVAKLFFAPLRRPPLWIARMLPAKNSTSSCAAPRKSG